MAPQDAEAAKYLSHIIFIYIYSDSEDTVWT